jgi:uncharacterized membrane protein
VSPARALQLAASASLLALIALCLAWELWLAPLRPGGSYLALKAAPLALPLYGVLSGRRYTYQWSSMFVLLYFMEGVMRAWSERGIAQALAAAEIALSISFFLAVVAYARLTRAGALPPHR